MLDLEVVGQGATTKMYRDDHKAVKVYENGPIREAENEARNQRIALEAGLPVPAVYGVRELDGGGAAGTVIACATETFTLSTYCLTGKSTGSSTGWTPRAAIRWRTPAARI